MLTTRTGRVSPFLILIIVGIVGSLANLPRGSAAGVQDVGPTFEEELLNGKDLLRQQKFEDALKCFKRANAMRDKKSAECYSWMTDAYLGLEAYKSVIAAANKVFELAGGDNALIIRAYNNKGLALQATAAKKDQAQLEAAEATFRQGLALPNPPAILRYNLGVVLMQLNRDNEGIAEIKQYIKLQPKGSY